MISNVSPSSLTYEDTYNTLRYADRAKKIKINLKKNIMSVDFQVCSKSISKNYSWILWIFQLQYPNTASLGIKVSGYPSIRISHLVKIDICCKFYLIYSLFQVGQYAKIVEDLKTQLNECKTKITSLEEENSALKNQVELDDQQRANASTMQQNHNHEEMELLKAQLAELEVI